MLEPIDFSFYPTQVFCKCVLLHWHKWQLGWLRQQLPWSRSRRHHRGWRPRRRFGHRWDWNSQRTTSSDGGGCRCRSPGFGNDEVDVCVSLVFSKVWTVLPACWLSTESKPSLSKIVLKLINRCSIKFDIKNTIMQHIQSWKTKTIFVKTKQLPLISIIRIKVRHCLICIVLYCIVYTYSIKLLSKEQWLTVAAHVMPKPDVC